MTDCVLVWTTVGVDTDAGAMATTLVEERLAACVALPPPIESVYRWRGGVERDGERQLLIKTTTARLPALRARLLDLHPYEVPELLVTPVIDGGADYLEWVRESVTPARG